MTKEALLVPWGKLIIGTAVLSMSELLNKWSKTNKEKKVVVNRSQVRKKWPPWWGTMERFGG
jgi:hypothetical protein